MIANGRDQNFGAGFELSILLECLYLVDDLRFSYVANFSTHKEFSRLRLHLIYITPPVVREQFVQF